MAAMTADVLDDRDSDFNLPTAGREIEFVIFRPNHGLIAKPEPRQVDRKPQLIFFYKNLQTDEVLPYTEAEAARMMQSSWRPILRQVGYSDWSVYRSHIKNCGIKAGARIPKAKAQEILTGAMAAELKQAKKNFAKQGYIDPELQNVHFDQSFKTEAQRRAFTPPN